MDQGGGDGGGRSEETRVQVQRQASRLGSWFQWGARGLTHGSGAGGAGCGLEMTRWASQHGARG